MLQVLHLLRLHHLRHPRTDQQKQSLHPANQDGAYLLDCRGSPGTSALFNYSNLCEVKNPHLHFVLWLHIVCAVHFAAFNQQYNHLLNLVMPKQLNNCSKKLLNFMSYVISHKLIFVLLSVVVDIVMLCVEGKFSSMNSSAFQRTKYQNFMRPRSIDSYML